MNGSKKNVGECVDCHVDCHVFGTLKQFGCLNADASNTTVL